MKAWKDLRERRIIQILGSYLVAGWVGLNVVDQVVGHRTDSFISGTVNRGDVYYVGVSDYFNDSYDPASLLGRSSGGTGGQYQLSVTFANNDRNGAIPQAVQSTTALPVTGLLGSIGTDLGTEVGDRDLDMFQLTPPSSGVRPITTSRPTRPWPRSSTSSP